MSEVVGSAKVTIEPDSSGFASQLQGQLDSIFAGVEKAADSAFAAIGDGLESAVDSAGDLNDEIGASSSTAQAVQGAIEGVASAGGDAAAAVAQIADETASVAEGASLAADAVNAVADAGDLAASAIESVGDGAEEASGGLIEAGGAADGLAASISGVLTQTGAARDEMGRFVNQSRDASGAVEGVGSAASSSKGPVDVLGEAGAVAAEKISSGFSDGGFAVTALAVAAGTIIGSAFESLIAKAQELVTFIPQLGQEFQSSYNSIRVQTGETGFALAGLEESFKRVTETQPSSLGDIATAIGLINTRLELTGEPLETLATGFLRFSRLTGTDLRQNIEAITGVFNNFNISAEDQGTKLDELFRVYQETGIPVAQLTSSMSTLGPIARQLGLSFEDTASLIGLLNEAGLDGGAVQLAFAKIMKKAADEGIDASTAFEQVFGGIRDGTIDSAQAIEIFGTRGARLFDLIKSGTLDYAAFSAQISAGGDTLAQAGADVTTWQGQLKILGNQLKLVLEPIAVTVFRTMTAAMKGIRPVVVGVATIVGGVLTGAFRSLQIFLLPVWELLDRVRGSFQAALDVFQSGGSVFDAVRTFFENLTGDSDLAQAVADRLGAFADAMSRVWEATAPARDALAQFFDVIRTGIADFVADNPVPVLAALGTTLLILVVPGALKAVGAIASLTQSLLGLAASVATNPFLLIAVAIGAIVGAFIYAYQNIEPFREAVDNLVSALSDALLPVLESVSDFVQTSVIPWLQQMADMATALWEAFAAGDAQGVGEVLDNIFGNTGALVGMFRDLGSVVLGFFTQMQQVAGPVLTELSNLLSGLGDVLGGIVSLDGDQLMAGLATVGASLQEMITNLLPTIYGELLNLGRGIINSILTGIAQVPFLAPLAEALRSAINGVFQLLGGQANLVTSLFTFDTDKIAEAARQMLAIFGSVLTEAIPGVLGNLGTFLSDNLASLVRSAFDSLLAQVGDIPFVGPIVELIKTQFVAAISAVGDLGTILAGIFSLDPGKIMEGLSGLAGTIGEALVGFAHAIPGLLLDALTGIVTATGTVFGEWLPKAITAGADLARQGIRAGFQFLADLPSIIGNLIVEYGPDAAKAIIMGILTGLRFSLFEIPKFIILELIPSLVRAIIERGPDLLVAIGELVQKIPTVLGSIASGLGGIFLEILNGVWTVINAWLGGLPGRLIDLLTTVWGFVVTAGPGILANVATWAAGIPGQILGWLGDLGSAIVGWVTGAWDWLVENGPQVLINVQLWWANMILNILGWLGDLGSALIGWIVGAWDWVVANGPTILLNILNWVSGVPGMIIGALGDFGSLLVGWMQGAFDWLVGALPGLAQGLFDWFTGLPGQLFGLIRDGITTLGGAALDFGKTIYNAIAGFINDNLINPIRGFDISVGPFSANDIFSFIPTLPTFHGGGVVPGSGEMLALLQGGEGIISRTGMAGIGENAVAALNSGGPAASMMAGIGGQQFYIDTMTVMVQAMPGMSGEEARRIGAAAVDGAVERAGELSRGSVRASVRAS